MKAIEEFWGVLVLTFLSIAGLAAIILGIVYCGYSISLWYTKAQMQIEHSCGSEK